MSWLFPDRCALCGRTGLPAWCPDCRAEAGTPTPATRLLAGDLRAGITLFPYAGRPAQAVRRLKYDRETALASIMATWLAETTAACEISYDHAVPIPIHPRRRRTRGFNQSELIAADLPRLAPALLRRVRYTKPQTQLSGEARRTSLHGAFAADPRVSGRRILLVDDVLTTGATALAAAQTLRGMGAADVYVLAFAGEE